MKFAILAPGHIANAMACAVKGIIEKQLCGTMGIEAIECYAVGSRNMDRAIAFAKQWGYKKAYGSYEALLEDSELELVYVASPHSHHYEHVKMCLEHGKHVLVEKAFTVNAKEAEELVGLAKEKNLLLAEAIWTRYMPSRQKIDELIAADMIGKVTSITANLGYCLTGKERLERPELAGGALLDLGVYPINFAMMVCQSEIKACSSQAVMSPQGVDWTNSITLTFENGVLAVLHSNMLSKTDRRGLIYGEKGYIEVHNINNCDGIRVYDRDDQLLATYEMPEQINGYEYEVLECVRAIGEGKIECPSMPHQETLRVMRLMDSIREEWGMKLASELKEEK